MTNIKSQYNERMAIYDNIKFLMITLVVIGHFADAFESYDACKSIYLFIYVFNNN